MKVTKISKETTDSRTYKMAMRSKVLGCPICGPNSGCNALKKGKQRNWKQFRKTQHKNGWSKINNSFLHRSKCFKTFDKNSLYNNETKTKTNNTFIAQSVE